MTGIQSNDFSEFDNVIEELERQGALTPQPMTVSTSFVTRSAKDKGFPLIDLVIDNPEDTPHNAFVMFAVDGKTYEQGVVAFPGVNELHISAADLGVDAQSFIGKTEECDIRVEDFYTRPFAKSRRKILFLETGKTQISASISFDNNIARIADSNKEPMFAKVVFESKDIIDANCTIVSVFGGIRNDISINVPANASKTVQLCIPSGFSAGGVIQSSVAVSVDGDVIAEDSSKVNVKQPAPKPAPDLEPKPEPKPAPSIPSGQGRGSKQDNGSSTNAISDKAIFANIAVLKFVDVHNNINGNVMVGKIKIINKTGRSEVVNINITVEGETCMLGKIHLDRREAECEVTVPYKILAEESSHYSDIRMMLKDDRDRPIATQIVTTSVRSVYDMDLSKIQLRTAQFVNPMSSAVKALVDKGNGLVVKNLECTSGIIGYQGSVENTMDQMNAVYKAIQSLGMKYVSDTFTIGSGFQCVRSPAKVISDRSGNCIELSILFASVFEAMGLTPILVFPRGHAMVGVEIGDGILFLESTMCASRSSTFFASVDSAKKTMDSEGDYIMSNNRFVNIDEMRGKQVNPELM